MGAPNTQPRIFAHRGSTLLAPENTAVAFDLALAHNAHVLETDVRLCRDGHVIVTHDHSVDRTTDGTGLVKELPLNIIKQLDAGYRTEPLDGKSHAGCGVQMLTLDELFERYPGIEINIDIKDNDVKAAACVAKTIERHNRMLTTTVASFHSRLLLHFRKMAPNIPTAAVRGEVAKLYFNRLVPGHHLQARPFDTVQIPISYKLIPLGTRKFINKVRSHGANICFWTVNDPEIMRRLLRLGANGVVTDRPDLARQVFTEFGFE